MSTYAAVRKAPLLLSDTTHVLHRPARRPAAMRPIPVLDVHHPLERDAQVVVARAFDAPLPPSPSPSNACSSPVAVDPLELQRAPGVALSPSTREPFEQRMGRGFSGVRVHVGAEASALAERLHARAFTYGRDIYFARGEFRPETREGRGLFAHELAHTLQPQARSGTPAIARFAAPGAAPPVISEAARTWLDAWSCVEPTSPQALALLAAFQRLPAAVQAEILAQFKVDTAATSAHLAEDLKRRVAMSKQRVIGSDGLGGTMTGTQEFVDDMKWFNQTSRGTAAVTSNALGAAGLGIGMKVFDDKERQLAAGEFGAGLGNIVLTGPGTNEALGYRGSRIAVDPIHYPARAAGYHAAPPVTGRLHHNQPKQFLRKELRIAKALGVTPQPAATALPQLLGRIIKWVVTERGALLIVPAMPLPGAEISHSVLTRGASVRAAGEAMVIRNEKGELVGEFISSYSGHYFRDKGVEAAKSLELGEAAFSAIGVRFKKRDTLGH